MTAVFIILGILVVLGLFSVASAMKVVQQFERGVVFRLGKVQPSFRAPGLTLIAPMFDRLQKVNMQTIAMQVPAQDGITQDNVSVRVDAVVYFRVVDPVKAVVNVQN
jgi:regulator of protease activity HflC (stomatin/prohibitin superfamily)